MYSSLFLKKTFRNFFFLLLATAQFHLISNESHSFDPTIPVLDMQDYFNPEKHEKFIDQLRSALKEVGFFAVINTQVDQNLLDCAYKSAQDYFDLDLETKMTSFSPSTNCQRGYVPGESAKSVSFKDFKEFYHVGREITKAENNYYANVWPSTIDLKNPLCALFDALESYKVPLEAAMAEAIGQPLDFFTEMTQDGDCLLRALHYPQSPPEDHFWAVEHTDIDLFTILPKATAEGLQVLNKQGEWIDVHVPENAFIINGGDMLENITNGEFRSSPHRVVANKSNTSRQSMVLFIHPKAEDRLDPLPQCIERTGGIRRFANATRWELLSERLADLGLASDEMLSYLANCGLIERLIEVKRASPKAMKRICDRGFATPAILKALEDDHE